MSYLPCHLLQHDRLCPLLLGWLLGRFFHWQHPSTHCLWKSEKSNQFTHVLSNLANIIPSKHFYAHCKTETWVLKKELAHLKVSPKHYKMRLRLKWEQRSCDCLQNTKKETNYVLFIRWNMSALFLPHV